VAYFFGNPVDTAEFRHSELPTTLASIM